MNMVKWNGGENPVKAETSRDLDYIGEQIIAMKAEGVACIVINHQYDFDVSLIYHGGADLEVARESGKTLAEAHAKADLSRQRKIAAARRAVDIAAAYACDWIAA